MEQDDKLIIVCHDKPTLDVAGEWVLCAECVLEIYLSDSTMRNVYGKQFTKDQVIYLCPLCALTKIKTEKEVEFIALSQEQLEEIRNHE